MPTEQIRENNKEFNFRQDTEQRFRQTLFCSQLDPSILNTLSGQYSESPEQYSGKSHSCSADLHSKPAGFKRQV